MHNLASQIKAKDEKLWYESKEVREIGSRFTKLKCKYHAQMYLLKAGLKELKCKGKAMVKIKLSQMHHLVYLKALAVVKMTRHEKKSDM